MTHLVKSYISFDSDNDMEYFKMIKSWNKTEESEFEYVDSLDIKALGLTDKKTVKDLLKERFKGCEVFTLIVGQNTKNSKFSRLEIETAVFSLHIPQLIVNLNGSTHFDKNLCSTAVLKFIAVYVPFDKDKFTHTLENLPILAEKWSVFYFSDNPPDKKI